MTHDDALEDPDGDEQAHEGAASLAHEGQRDACHGEYAEVHGDVDERLHENEDHDPHRDQLARRIACDLSDANTPHEKDDEQTEEHQGAYKAEFFTEYTENKVLRWHLEIAELGLSTIL